MKAWFEEWFDSPYYHLLYQHRDEKEANDFIARLALKLEMREGAKVLDVACGKGRHAVILSALGFEVTGIDLSKNSIDSAKQFQKPTLHFDVWDMRKSYKTAAFDYVLNLFSSFGYFDREEDDLAAMRAFADELKPGGKLVIDYINTEAAIRNMKAREIVPRGDVHFQIRKRVEGGFIIKNIDFLADGVDHQFEERLQVINLMKFKELIANAGLTLQTIYGDYDLHPFTPATSPRLILVASK